MKKFITLKVIYVLYISILMIVAYQLPYMHDTKRLIAGIFAITGLSCLSFLRIREINKNAKQLFDQQESGIFLEQDEIGVVQYAKDFTWMGTLTFFLGLIAAFSAARTVMFWFGFKINYNDDYFENSLDTIIIGTAVIGILLSFILLKLGVRSSISNHTAYRIKTYSMSKDMFYSLVGFDYQQQVLENHLKIKEYTEISYIAEENETLDTEKILKRVVGYFNSELKPQFKHDLQSKIEKDMANKRKENDEIILARKLANEYS